jgi:flagellar basal-body rod modification protein FlgD
VSTTPVTSTAPSSGSNGTTSSGLPSSQSLNNMFIQLLVAQLQNQDPLDPLDPSQFVGELAQFSELSEVTQIEQLLQGALGSSATSGTGTGSMGSSNPNSNAKGSAPANDLPAGSIAVTNPLSLITPLPSVSAAAAAAQNALPKFATPISSILNRQVQGVF